MLPLHVGHPQSHTSKTGFVRGIGDALTSPVGQFVIGFGLGCYLHKIYMPITEKVVVKLLGAMPPDPFGDMDLVLKIILAPFASFVAPVVEEVIFRENLQEGLKGIFEFYFINQCGLSRSVGELAAATTAIFFSSIIFGLVHFYNALELLVNPVVFLPQVVAATLMGLVFGVAKEATGELFMPIGMHMGNNVLATAYILKASF